MLVTTHMYYAKTFIPGQFSPEYWDVPTNVLTEYDYGTVIMSNTLQPTTGLVRPTEIYILAMDGENSIPHSNYGSTFTTTIETSEVDITHSNLDDSQISGFEIKPITIDLKQSWQAKFLSTISFDVSNNVSKSNLDSIGTSVIETYEVDLEPANYFAGNNFTGYEVQEANIQTSSLGWLSDSTYQDLVKAFVISDADIVITTNYTFGLYSEVTLAVPASVQSIANTSDNAVIYGTTAITPAPSFL